LSWSPLISPRSRLARASFNGAVRKRLPTTSARNGGLLLVIGTLPPAGSPERSGSRLFRQLQIGLLGGAGWA
jgi:hypothetical protein